MSSSNGGPAHAGLRQTDRRIGLTRALVPQLRDCAYVLMERLRALGLASTEFARAQVQTSRLKLLKIGAVVLCNIPHTRECGCC